MTAFSKTSATKFRKPRFFLKTGVTPSECVKKHLCLGSLLTFFFKQKRSLLSIRGVLRLSAIVPYFLDKPCILT
uniref:Uncharacterized protein n=1 Tax=Cyprinodon variegatus TaxID=28743 RepID=A0A3Q2D7E5_CYPVA